MVTFSMTFIFRFICTVLFALRDLSVRIDYPFLYIAFIGEKAYCCIEVLGITYINVCLVFGSGASSLDRPALEIIYWNRIVRLETNNLSR